jgi:CRP/FNR family transcriptional regulator, dissimilatory nitrate respiration regulator
MVRREIAPEVFLAGLPLFKALDAATLARLAAATTRRALKRGETLFRKGDPATGMYVVVYGEIKLIATTPMRGPRLAGIVGPGHSLGEPVMFLERPAVVDAQAGSDALLLHLPKAAVFEEIERNPKFARRMIAGLSQRIERLVCELDRQALGSGSERFIDYLLRHGRGQAGAFVVTLPAAKARALLAHPARAGASRAAAGAGPAHHGGGSGPAPASDASTLTPQRPTVMQALQW